MRILVDINTKAKKLVRERRLFHFKEKPRHTKKKAEKKKKEKK